MELTLVEATGGMRWTLLSLAQAGNPQCSFLFWAQDPFLQLSLRMAPLHVLAGETHRDLAGLLHKWERVEGPGQTWLGKRFKIAFSEGNSDI